jgi:hypothetical protein
VLEAEAAVSAIDAAAAVEVEVKVGREVEV